MLTDLKRHKADLREAGQTYHNTIYDKNRSNNRVICRTTLNKLGIRGSEVILNSSMIMTEVA